MSSSQRRFGLPRFLLPLARPSRIRLGPSYSNLKGPLTTELLCAVVTNRALPLPVHVNHFFLKNSYVKVKARISHFGSNFLSKLKFDLQEYFHMT